jgi:hypothetical protein
MAKKTRVDRLNKKLGPPQELTVGALIEALQKLPSDTPVYLGNMQPAMGVEIREGRIHKGWMGESSFQPVPDGKRTAVFLTGWSENSMTGELDTTIYTGA